MISIQVWGETEATHELISAVSHVPYPYLMTLEEMQLKNSTENDATMRAHSAAPRIRGRSNAPQVRMTFHQWICGRILPTKMGAQWGCEWEYDGAIANMNSSVMIFERV